MILISQNDNLTNNSIQVDHFQTFDHVYVCTVLLRCHMMISCYILVVDQRLVTMAI
jgi:hypothetical protein